MFKADIGMIHGRKSCVQRGIGWESSCATLQEGGGGGGDRHKEWIQTLRPVESTGISKPDLETIFLWTLKFWEYRFGKKKHVNYEKF